MIARLTDATIRHLQMVADVPDLSHTKYEISHLIGSGGMGAVYAARDRQLGRLVALKVVGTFAASSEMIARLLREARILAQLEHPGIVPVHDVATLPDGRAFYTMKLVQGQRLDRHVTASTPLAERLRIFERLCDTVAFAHAHGVMHRDLKPANIMVGAFGEVLVMDWGVAAARDERGAGIVVGTPGFMSPEQQRGDPVDERADIYALGAILTLLLGDVEARASEHGERPRWHEARTLRAIARRAMAEEREARYASVELLAADLARSRAGLPTTALPEGLIDRGIRVAINYRVPLALVGAYLLMRIILVLFFKSS
jgi:serine/threonine protein kinase